MRYVSIFSGIEAATVAWKSIGWKAVAYSEIEKFPLAVLAHRFPKATNLGDMTKAYWAQFRGKADLVCGGPPCQDFSIAGLRKSLGGIRGKLTLKYVEAIHAIRPVWNLTENVPGWLNTEDNAFGAFLAGLVGAEAPLVSTCEGGAWPSAGIANGPIYGVAWRVLNAEYFGVPQRRRRVFVVGYLGDWRRAAQVLFEPQGLRGDSVKGKKKRAGVAALTADGVGTCGADDNQAQGGHIIPIQDGRSGHSKQHGVGIGNEGDPAGSLDTKGAQAVAAVIFEPRRYTRDNKTGGEPEKKCPPLEAKSAQGDSSPHLFSMMPQNSGKDFKARKVDVAQPVMAAGPTHGNQGGDVIQSGMTVRRLTPRECERLQGFPDDWTLIPWREKPIVQCPDGPRYKAVGNSWAVPCARWIGERIQAVSEISK